MVRLLLAATMLACGAGALVTPAAALSAKDCSTKYQAAKQAGTLNGQKWNDFRKAECGADASGTTANTVPNPVAPGATKTAAPAPAPAPAAPAARPTAAAPAAGTAAYPSAVDPKYASESAGKARMHTCLDSYNAAKSAGTLGDAKWIQKGGGYYSVCNKRLKG
ncbi:hypothetical protein MKL09_08250 [Methylobacterium sp. J-048]|uniref:hypothetical protein n=1 Tax=Methylobacterium sp. J-048 TaxID=2836635 RepID=UPI001FBB8C1E|nr:hypothetical protein [Methylobacterium sp. J-048]MCJ2056543.1 hypothetical protein [Methylobacterium sp. J-048]